MQTSEQTIRQKAAAATVYNKENRLVAVDSWTPHGNIRTRRSAARRQDWKFRVDAMFTRAISSLNDTNFLWLTRDTQWLDRGQITIQMPQTHVDNCGYKDRKCKSHQEAFFKEPKRHGRFAGTISLARHDPLTLVATVRLLDGLHSAVTVQLRDRKPPRLVAALGVTEEIMLAASVLHSYLARLAEVENDLRRTLRIDPTLSAALDPLHQREGIKRVAIDPHDMIRPYQMAGSFHSPERLYWNSIARKKIDGLYQTRVTVKSFLLPIFQAG